MNRVVRLGQFVDSVYSAIQREIDFFSLSRKKEENQENLFFFSITCTFQNDDAPLNKTRQKSKDKEFKPQKRNHD